MIEDHSPLVMIDDLIAYVGGIQQLHIQHTDYQEFPDRTIASFYNHIGNAKQFVSDETVAFNAAEQYLSQKSAINEIQAALEDLFLLQHKGALGVEYYRSLERKLMAIDECLRAQTDPDYAHD